MQSKILAQNKKSGMTVARALVVCAPPLAFVCLLPLLRLVVGADGTPYAGVDSDFVSLSALVGRAPAAGTFGLLVGALLGTLGVRDDLTRTWAQRAALALTYVTGLLFFSTPLQFSPAAHKASTAALMVALTAVLAAQTHAFPHRAWPAAACGTAVLLGTLVLRVSVEFADVGWGYFAAEVLFFASVLLSTILTARK
jgi:hypothetical protein